MLALWLSSDLWLNYVLAFLVITGKQVFLKVHGCLVILSTGIIIIQWNCTHVHSILHTILNMPRKTEGKCNSMWYPYTCKLYRYWLQHHSKVSSKFMNIVDKYVHFTMNLTFCLSTLCLWPAIHVKKYMYTQSFQFIKEAQKGFFMVNNKAFVQNERTDRSKMQLMEHDTPLCINCILFQSSNWLTNYPYHRWPASWNSLGKMGGGVGGVEKGMLND